MADRYRPLFKLDSGGMAEVYVAEADSLGGFTKKVAIKRILPGLLKEERFVRMFLDEARLSLHLNHANIVTVFDLGKSDNTYFIVMEYVEGLNLKSLLEAQSMRGTLGLPVPLVGWVVNEILKGLDYAHRLVDAEGQSLNIVHRDISPPNILISWNGEIKLTDFGLAKATTQLEATDPGVVKGKFAYLSPEAAYGQPIDHRADVFAVGILAFEMLTGRQLFVGDTDFQIVEAVRRAEIPSMRALNPDIPEGLEQIIRKSLAREPDERYQTASDFADDVLSFLFSHSLKVSSRDLRAYLEDFREQAVVRAKQHVSNLILELIKDELLQFRSLDSDSGDGPLSADPSQDSGYAYDGSAPLTVEDFSSGRPSRDTALGNLASTPHPSHLPKEDSEGFNQQHRRERAPTLPPGAMSAPRSLAPWLLLGVLAAGGGAVLYWFTVLGA